MFSFFKRKNKTKEITEKPVEPVLETRQPASLEEAAALTPVSEHQPVLPDEAPAEAQQPVPPTPPVEEPPGHEPPAKEPPAETPPADEPPVKQPPVEDPDSRATTQASPVAARVPPAPPVIPETGTPVPDSAFKIQTLPPETPVDVPLSDKASGGAHKPQVPAAQDVPGIAPDRATAVPEPALAAPELPATTPAPVPETAPASVPEAPVEQPAAPVETVAPVASAASLDAPAVVTGEPAPKPEKKSWLSRLKDGLSRTGSSISTLFVGVKVDENLFEELETALIMADAGVEATESLLQKLRAKVKKERIEDGQVVKRVLRDLLAEHLAPLEKKFQADTQAITVVMIAGVNGAGKTTSIGKLAHHFQAQGHSVLLAAGDTFRAAAREQLVEWGARNNVAVIAQDGGDPAAVAFDAVNAGRARKASIVMVDTAGRLPTQLHLMEELKKIKRVITKADGEAPHEVLLVVDGNTGQNAISQIKAFDAALTLTGLVVTKLDGTAKGGTLAAVAAGSQGVRPVPVYWIGVGESLQDLQPFVATEFASALLGD